MVTTTFLLFIIFSIYLIFWTKIKSKKNNFSFLQCNTDHAMNAMKQTQKTILLMSKGTFHPQRLWDKDVELYRLRLSQTTELFCVLPVTLGSQNFLIYQRGQQHRWSLPVPPFLCLACRIGAAGEKLKQLISRTHPTLTCNHSRTLISFQIGACVACCSLSCHSTKNGPDSLPHPNPLENAFNS